MREPQIITETRQWLAVNKPAGLNVERFRDYPSLEQWVYAYLKQQTGRADPYLGIVHRLDRVTSGVVLLARNKSTLRHLNQQFAERRVHKTYRAQVAAELSPGSEGELVHYLRKDQLQQRAFAYAQPKSSRKRALLHYKCLATAADRSELEIHPATGRYHQIRVQLAAEGWPIIGDTRYGAAVALPGNRIMLHADRLEFQDPRTNEPRVVVAPAPPDEAWLTGSQ